MTTKDVIAAYFDAFNAGDVDAMLALLDTDAEIDKFADLVLRIPETDDLLAPVNAAVPPASIRPSTQGSLSVPDFGIPTPSMWMLTKIQKSAII